MLDNTGFFLRERAGFEAMDAGLLLYRRNFLRIQLSYVGFFLPLLIAGLFLPYELLWISPLIIWWLRPLWDRLILRKLAHTFFNSEGKAAWKGIFRGLFSDLTWRRFSLWRHYAQPVRALEGLKGKPLRNRVHFIFGDYRAVAFALGAVMFVLEIAFLSGVIAFVSNMNSFIPHVMRSDLTFQTPWVYPAIILSWGVISAVTVPAAVSMGFALYINRRVIIEGWDLEVAFTRRAVYYRSTLGAILLALVLGLGTGTVPAHAQDPPIESLEQILESDDFGENQTRTGWRWKDDGAEFKQNENSGDILNGLFGNAGKMIAATLRILLISAAIFVVGAIIWKNRHVLFGLVSEGSDNRDRSSGTRNRLMGKEGTLPPLDSAQVLYNEGNHRDAWSVLYRHLILILGRPIPDSPGMDATEGEWLRALREPGKDQKVRLINGWREIAYAHRDPGGEEFVECHKALSGMADSASETPE